MRSCLPVIFIALVLATGNRLAVAAGVVSSSIRLNPITSIESMVADCDLVIRGRFTKQDGFDGQVTMLELLKGDPPPFMGSPSAQSQPFSFSARRTIDAFLIPSNAETILFLRRQANPSSYTPPYEIMQFIPLNGVTPAFTMDMRSTSKQEELLAAVREAIAFSTSQSKRHASLIMPSSIRPRPRNVLVVPADQRLESLARAWATSSDVEMRVAAVHALSYFKSDENIAILKSMLSDTGLGGRVNKWSSGLFVVRDEAYQQLRWWSVTVPRPLFYGPSLLYEPIQVWIWLLLRILPVALALAIVWFILHRRADRLGTTVSARSILLALMYMLAIIASVACAYSFWHVHEIMVRAGGHHHEIASYRGGIQWICLDDWHEDGPDVAGSFNLSRSTDCWVLTSFQTDYCWNHLDVALATGTAEIGATRTHPYTLVRIPYWLLLCLLWFPLFPALMRALRRRRRRARGLCPACGYDLRASRDRCPECGTAVPQRSVPLASP